MTLPSRDAKFHLTRPTPKRTREEYESEILSHPLVHINHVHAYMRRYDLRGGLVDLPPYRDEIDTAKRSTWPDILHPRDAVWIGMDPWFSCAWVDFDGIVYACRFGHHEIVAEEYFGMPTAEAEKSYARVSHDMSSTAEMVCGLEPKKPASEFRMYKAILRFIYKRPEYADCIRSFVLPEKSAKPGDV